MMFARPSPPLLTPRQDFLYGSANTNPLKVPLPMNARRRQTNLFAAAVNLFVPWLSFTGIYYIMSFRMHYNQPGLAWFLVAAFAVLTLVAGSFAAWHLKKRSEGSFLQPSWYLFMFCSLLTAWVLGVALGSHNFVANMDHYYNVVSLNLYPSVDPSRMNGQQYMDAGRVMFARGSHQKMAWASGFRSNDMYCVVPITFGNNTLASYDFWAVGKNCCSGAPGDFHCGEDRVRYQYGGLRMLADRDLPFYRLAVQQVQSSAHINARHPLFFTWEDDPIGALNAYQDRGFKNYVFCTLLFFSWQLFSTVVAVVVFRKYGGMEPVSASSGLAVSYPQNNFNNGFYQVA